VATTSARTGNRKRRLEPAFGFERRHYYVVGASASGQSIARFLLRAGHRVSLSDRDPGRALESATVRLGGAIQLARGRHDPALAARADLVVLAPETEPDDAIADFARRRGKRVLSALEFVANEARIKLVAIVGSGGKTATLSVVRRLLADPIARGRVFVADRRPGFDVTGALDGVRCRHVVAALEVADLARVDRLEPELMVVTKLVEPVAAAEPARGDGSLDAMFGFLARLEGELPVVASEHDWSILMRHLGRSGARHARIGVDILPDALDATRLLAERVRRILDCVGVVPSPEPREILEAIRCREASAPEHASGRAMPVRMANGREGVSDQAVGATPAPTPEAAAETPRDSATRSTTISTLR